MIRLLLIRHGKTDWNAQHRYQGQIDVPLNHAGCRQAAALARRLQDEDLSAIYTSDLQRARQTAQEIATPHGLSVWTEPRLREMSFGDWEGLTYAQIQARGPEKMARWFADPVRVPPPGGETLTRLAERVRAALDDIVRACANQTVALVSHGGTVRILLCAAMGLDLRAQWRFGLSNASLSELRLYDTNVVLTKLNDTHHLEPRDRDADLPPHQAGADRKQREDQWDD